jgi:hypothetical protein
VRKHEVTRGVKVSKSKHRVSAGSGWPQDTHVPTKTETSSGKHSDLDLGVRGGPVYTFGCAWMTHTNTACGNNT